MRRRNFLKLSGTVGAGLAFAPLDVLEGVALASTTAYYVFVLQWGNRLELCTTLNCGHVSDGLRHYASKLLLNRVRIDALDAKEAKAKVTNLIPPREGRIIGEAVKVADAPEWHAQRDEEAGWYQ